MTTSLNSNRPVLDQDGREAQSRLRTLTAATTLTQEQHDGQLLLLDLAAGFAVTLPAANGTGAKFRFYVKTTASGGNYTILTSPTTDQFVGFAHQFGDDATAVGGFSTTSATTITLDGSTRGGFAGDYIEIEDVLSAKWSVRVFGHATGTEATCFS